LVKKFSSVKTKTALAKELGVSRASLYWKSKMDAKDKSLLPKIKEIMSENPSYGHKRIAIALKLNKKRILRIMKKHNLKPARRRPQRPRKPGDENKPSASYPNLVKDFCPICPNIIWVSDFTYISFQGRFIYLATIMDLFTRLIIGWNILVNHPTELVKGAFEHAAQKTKKVPQILHSDQGSEYDSREYTNLLKENKIAISMNAKASPWQNPFQESFYSGFKLDFGEPNRFNNLGELVEAIYQAINYYNNSRIHTKLKSSPQEFYLKYLTKFDPVITLESVS
jgi:transposase InsO family protein